MTPREKAAGRLRERNLRTKVWATVLSARSRRATIPGVRAVLVVDDHPTFRRTARALLESGRSEVARRTGNGVDVALLWSRAQSRLKVMVSDGRLCHRLDFDVAGADEISAFREPFADAAALLAADGR